MKYAKQNPSFGIQWADGVAFLLQKRGIANAMGVDVPSPFTINPKAHCPHHIVVPMYGTTHSQKGDPLFQVMSPVPGRGVFLIQHDVEIVRQLEQLCSPVEELTHPWWYLGFPEKRQRLEWTNVAPQVFSEVTPRDTGEIMKLIQLASLFERRVLLVTRDWMPAISGVTVIKSNIATVLAPETLQSVGAAMLTRHMLNEPATPST